MWLYICTYLNVCQIDSDDIVWNYLTLGSSRNFYDKLICFTLDRTEAPRGSPLPNFTAYLCFQLAS